MPRRSRPAVRDREATEQVAVRLSRSLLERVDRHLERLQGQVPGWVTVTRADAIRALLLDALDRVEGRQGR